jgi:asparagine synthase (glutamine-hydrolysing)
MCGFSGISFSSPLVRDRFPHSLDTFRGSAARIAYRGDSDHREYISDRLWLSHYRLAFQDVQAGIQPMLSHDGRHVIVYNGEVYNHLQLRDKIQDKSGVSFKTRSDTETILEGWKAFGDAIFSEFDGEYAFVILEVKTGALIAHRDRYGVKPLFLRLPGVNTRQFAVHRSA